MIVALAALLGCQLAGGILVRAFGLPLPGPVAGLGLLFVALVIRGRQSGDPQTAVPADLAMVCDALMRNLSLLFIPAAVGVVKYLDVLRDRAVPLLVAITVSTTLALVVTAFAFRIASGLTAFRHAPPTSEIEADSVMEDER